MNRSSPGTNEHLERLQNKNIVSYYGIKQQQEADLLGRHTGKRKLVRIALDRDKSSKYLFF